MLAIIDAMAPFTRMPSSLRYLQLLVVSRLGAATTTTSTSSTTVSCSVVVVGGSVAGLAAAITSAKEGAKTCLLEPTDMLGGQMTANGIPALDFTPENGRAPFNVSGATLDSLKANHAEDLTTLLRSLPGPNNHDTCWVSPYCYLPTTLAGNGIQALVDSAGGNLLVYRNTVLLNATMQQGNLQSVVAVQRTATAAEGCGGYNGRLSHTLRDWYSPAASPNFTKQLLTFDSNVWVDTSYNGELLVLTGAPYLQGIDETFDGDTRGTEGNDTIGQSFTMPYQIHLHDVDVEQQKAEDFPAFDHNAWEWPDPFRASPAIHTPTHTLSWESLWTRRRSFHNGTNSNAAGGAAGSGGAAGAVSAGVGADDAVLASGVGKSDGVGMDPPLVNIVSPGDVHLAAWPDFYYGYIFNSKAETTATISTSAWAGGYNLKSIDGAERYSYGAYRAYRDAAPAPWRNKTRLNSTFMGTCTGLTKMPYIRDGQ